MSTCQLTLKNNPLHSPTNSSSHANNILYYDDDLLYMSLEFCDWCDNPTNCLTKR